MKSLFSIALLLSITCLGVAQKKEKQQIKQCFENYKRTIIANEGEKAVTYLSQKIN